ncbi:RNA-guided endonuclease TnpB family protein, partial [Streptomyces sp. NPDC001970]
MKVVVQVKLLPSPEVGAALAATLRVCNRAADAASVLAYERGATSRNELQKLVYARLKAEFGLAAQPAVRTVKKVVDAYTTLRANIRAGNLGPAGSKRRRRAESKPVVFRPDAAQPYDDRILSWQHDARTISIWTVAGRIKSVRYTGHPAQLAMLEKYRRGESDLVHRAGMWF